MLCFTTRLLYENVVKTQMDRKEVWYNLDVYNPAEKSNIFASRDKVGDPSRSGRRIFLIGQLTDTQDFLYFSCWWSQL